MDAREEAANDEEKLVVKDANGTLLADGDSVTIVKTLKVKGASTPLKIGTKVKNIRLVEGDHTSTARSMVSARCSSSPSSSRSSKPPADPFRSACLKGPLPRERLRAPSVSEEGRSLFACPALQAGRFQQTVSRGGGSSGPSRHWGEEASWASDAAPAFGRRLCGGLDD